MKVLAVDFGDRRTGLAATDATGKIAVPLPTLTGLTQERCAAAIATLARERATEIVVVGLPLDADGSRGPRALKTLAFVGRLRKVAPCPVTTIDESHTTDEAHERLAELPAARRRRLADQVAAIVILERYLAGGR